MTKNNSWYARVPKVELHLHLEGAIPLPALWELIQKYGGEPSIPDLAALKNKFQFRDFPHFIRTWGWKTQFIREYDDLTLIAEATARDLVSQNIWYAEVFFTPSDLFRHGLKTQSIARAVRAGLSKVPEIQISLVADFCRNDGPANAERVVEELNEVKSCGVIGVTIGGSEQEFPPQPFAPAYQRARLLGFRTSAHAGEAAGSESIWGAIQSLKVERIGHGTRAFEDPTLVKFLADHQIPLEICPLSNVRTRVVENIKDHPVRNYFEKGLLFSISTDDPMMFGNSLTQEYQVMERELGFSRDEIKTVILAGVRSSWLTSDRKAELIKKFSESHEWQE
jgi:adenosine deaminase